MQCSRSGVERHRKARSNPFGQSVLETLNHGTGCQPIAPQDLNDCLDVIFFNGLPTVRDPGAHNPNPPIVDGFRLRLGATDWYRSHTGIPPATAVPRTSYSLSTTGSRAESHKSRQIRPCAGHRLLGSSPRAAFHPDGYR